MAGYAPVGHCFYGVIFNTRFVWADFMKFLFADIRVAFNLIVKARFLLLSASVLVALAIVLLVSAQFSGRQPASVAMDVGFSFIRFSLPVLIALLMQELISKELDRKYFLLSFSYPHSRSILLLGRLLSVGLFVLMLLVLMSLLMGVLIYMVQAGYDQGRNVSFGWPYFIALFFLYLDLMVLLSVACFLAVVSTTPGFVLIGTLGFMLVARSFYPIIQLLTQQEYLVADAEQYRQSLGVLTYLLPDLSRLDLRAMPLYDSMGFLPGDAWLVVSAAFSYIFALYFLSVWLLNRRRLS